LPWHSCWCCPQISTGRADDQRDEKLFALKGSWREVPKDYYF